MHGGLFSEQQQRPRAALIYMTCVAMWRWDINGRQAGLHAPTQVTGADAFAPGADRATGKNTIEQ